MNENVQSQYISDDGVFPNNEARPVIVYPGAADTAMPSEDIAAQFESTFAENGWTGSWRNGVFSYHHYHSNTHEVLGCYSGSARVQLGGDEGPEYEISAGDVVVIPAGVAHKNLSQSSDFRVVGAYPEGRRPDMNYGKPGEREKAISAISGVPIPKVDPVGGADGPLPELYAARFPNHATRTEDSLRGPR